MNIDKHLRDSIIRHMLSDKSREMCGLVVESGGILKFIPCENIHPESKENFKISGNDYIKASISGKVVAVCHSHIDGGMDTLSSNDRMCQYFSGLIWILYKDGLSHDGIMVYQPVSKLKEREFSEGYCDCYDSFRDFYTLAGHEMGSYGPDEGYRIDGWYKQEGAESPFLQHIEREGFYKLNSSSELEPGDVILSLLGAKVPNHASVYIGNNYIFHHLPGRLSGCELMKSFYMKYAHSFWRHSKRDELNINEVINILNRS